MRYVWAIVAVLILGVAGYYVYNLPEVNVLFQSEKGPEKPLDFLENLPEPKIPEPPPRKPRKAPKPNPEPAVAASASQETPPEASEPVGQNQVPNGVVARTLMQILAAKKLASGLSLSVTDTEIAIHGTVDSREKRREILDVIEKGREYRKINTDDLTVE
jgi:hypothetical protein